MYDYAGYDNVYDATPWDRTKVANIVIEDGVTSIGNYAFDNCRNLKSVTIGKDVVSIGSNAFYRCTSLNSVNIPDKVTSIGTLAFYQCKSLTGVDLPNGLLSIGESAFEECKSLKSIVIPNSVTTVASDAFKYCSSAESVTIGTGLSIIENGVFYGCASLTSVEIPDNITSIGDNAFGFCYSLKSVTFGNNVKTIGGSAFSACSDLESVEIPDSVTMIDRYAFSDCTSLKSVSFGINVSDIRDYAFDRCESLTEITIPTKVKEIKLGIFRGCCSLTSVTIHDNVHTIGSYAFWECTSLPEINIPDSVSRILDRAFIDCSSLVTVSISKNVYEIGESAFSGCASLESINVSDANNHYSSTDGVLFDKYKTVLIQFPSNKAVQSKDGTAVYGIPNDVKKIEELAFENCDSLTGVLIPETVTVIGYGAFENCDSLTSVDIPKSVTEIGLYAFKECESLTSINVSDENLNYKSTDGVLFTKDGSALIQYPSKKVGTTYEIPSGVGWIWSYAFEDCASLSVVSIPDTVGDIAGYAFKGCASLESVVIPNNVTCINAFTFYKCTSLKSVVIPNNVITIDGSAFADCVSLSSVDIPDSVMSIGSYAFAGCTSLKTIKIPKNVTGLSEESFYGCSSLESITLDEGNSAFKLQDGVLYKSNLKEIVCYPNNKPDKSYTIPASVDPDYNDIEIILSGCNNLLNIYVNKYSKYQSVDGCLVYDGKLLVYPAGRDYVKIPQEITDLGKCFSGRNLKSVDLSGNSFEYIEGPVFFNCFNLETVILDENAEKVIKEHALEPYAPLFHFDDLEEHTVEIVASKGFEIPENIRGDVKLVYTTVNYDDTTKKVTVDGSKTDDGKFIASANVPSEAEEVVIDFTSSDANDKTSLTISKEVCDALFTEASTVSFSAKDVTSTVDASIKQNIGNATVFDLSLSVNGEQKHQFGGKVTVVLPYTLKDGESAGDVKAYYIDGSGNITLIGGTYSDGYITFETDHFSYYAVTSQNLISEDGSSNTWIIIVVAIVVIVIVAIVAVFIVRKR